MTGREVKVKRKPKNKLNGKAEGAGGATRVFRAGCLRERPGPAEEVELAYTALEYPECPSCPHRLEPVGAPSFCRWLPREAAHPFASLAGFSETLL